MSGDCNRGRRISAIKEEKEERTEITGWNHPLDQPEELCQRG